MEVAEPHPIAFAADVPLACYFFIDNSFNVNQLSTNDNTDRVIPGLLRNRKQQGCCMQLTHRSDSIQGTDYIAIPIQGFPGQKN